MAIKLKLNGAYIPSFNKSFGHLSYNLKNNFKIFGSAHNIKEIRIKELQKVQGIFLSSLFKKNKNYLGINKFKLLSKATNRKIIALGGISKKNLKKLKLIDSFGFAGILSCLMNLSYKLESFSQEKDNNVDIDELAASYEVSDEVAAAKVEAANMNDDDEDVDDDEDDDDDANEDEDEDEDHDHTHTLSHSHEKFDSKNNPLDMKATIKDALVNFDPDTLKNMTKDTSKLIKEQAELMSTISKMQPIIEKGMNMLDKFQGNGKTQELFEKFAKMQKLKNKN